MRLRADHGEINIPGDFGGGHCGKYLALSKLITKQELFDYGLIAFNQQFAQHLNYEEEIHCVN